MLSGLSGHKQSCVPVMTILGKYSLTDINERQKQKKLSEGFTQLDILTSLFETWLVFGMSIRIQYMTEKLNQFCATMYAEDFKADVLVA